MNTMIDPAELQQKNPWWENAAFIAEDDKIKEFELQKYKYRHPLETTFPLSAPGILTLRGPRQIGKTTLVKLVIQNLLAKKVPAQNIFYYSCNLVANYKELAALLKEYLEFFTHKTSGMLFIFLDEVSFVTDWPRAIKEIAEGPWGKKILFLLTGSSTIDLKFSSERLPGRRGKIQNLDFEFLPLSFKEFIQTVKPSLLEKDPKKALYKKLHYRHLFREYLLCGGFPAVINSYYKNNLIETFTYKLYTAWISGDLHKMGKSDTLADQMLAKLILSLSTPISIYEITKESGLASHGTTAEYLELFEELYCLARLNCYLIPQKRFDPKKNHKFYFLDPFILNSLHAKIKESLDEGFSLSKRFINNPVIYPHLVESVVAAHLKRKTATQLFYGRLDKEKEVDFVRVSKLGEEFFEVKYQKTIKTSEFYPIAKAIGNKKLTIITRDTFAKEKNIQMLPLEVFLATLD